jgi:hypothetical protein
MTILNTSITNENANHQPYTGIRTLGAGTYDYQLDVRAKFEGSAYNILTMPSGSGKSFVQAALAVLDIIASGYTHKQIILVPQVLRRASFRRTTSRLYSRFRVKRRCTARRS